jgi:hypothetical protein
LDRPKNLRPGLAAIALLLTLAPASRAAERCPWINAATAGGILGGPVTASVGPPEANPSCAFTRPGAELRIEIIPIKSAGDYASLAAACGANPEPLKAIGNQAVLCTVAGTRTSVRVIGRVRDRIFTMLIHSDESSFTAGLTTDRLREKARAAAEHVAGNLF